jgi:hypothetical protein
MQIGRDRKSFRNTSGIDSKLVRRIIRFVMPDNVDSKLPTIWVKSTSHGYAGRYYGYRRPHIVIKVGKQFPRRLSLYQYGQNKGKRHFLASREEALVYVAAHECRHFAQQYGKHRNCAFPLGYVRNARGRFSEIDTEAYAVHKLRAWRSRGERSDHQQNAAAAVLNRSKARSSA